MDCTNNKGPLRIVYGDSTLGVHGEDVHYIFSYAVGGLESLVKDGLEWLYRAPKPTFWRALTDNDRGSRFHLSSGRWLAADTFIQCKEISVFVDGKPLGCPCAPMNNKFSDQEYAKEVTITFVYETIVTPVNMVEVTYTVTEAGTLKVFVHYHGVEGLPQLPVFGLRMIMPTLADKYRYEGLSGETYPDRKAGGIKGVYEVEDLSPTPYLVPQDCGVHMDTEWVEIYRHKSLDNSRKEEKVQCLKVCAAEKKFAFSCLPYTASELENATHQEELPPARRTVLCIYGAVRGVGGIDSWGSDVEKEYRIDAGKDIVCSFEIKM